MTGLNVRAAAGAVLIVLLAAGAFAQERVSNTSAASTSVQELVLRDGSRLYGTIESENDAEVVFRTAAGVTITAPRAEIMTLRRLKGSVANGEFQRDDPNATRLFFGPTGRSLAKGQTYLGVYEFIMPFVQVGVTDRFSIGGGTPLVFGIDDWERPFWVTPKLQVLHTPRADVAVGVLHAFDVDGDGGGIGYAVVTTGNGQGSLTAGAGVAYAVEGGRAAVVMVGGERRVARNIKLISENYVWNGGNGVLSAGVRFFGERLSADLALGMPLGVNEFFLFPVVNFVYAF